MRKSVLFSVFTDFLSVAHTCLVKGWISSFVKGDPVSSCQGKPFCHLDKFTLGLFEQKLNLDWIRRCWVTLKVHWSIKCHLMYYKKEAADWWAGYFIQSFPVGKQVGQTLSWWRQHQKSGNESYHSNVWSHHCVLMTWCPVIFLGLFLQGQYLNFWKLSLLMHFSFCSSLFTVTLVVPLTLDSYFSVKWQHRKGMVEPDHGPSTSVETVVH